MSALRSQTLDVRDVARLGLVDDDEVVLPRNDAWDDLWSRVRDERAVPLLAQGVRSGAVSATPDQVDAIRHAHEDVMRACVQLERCALREHARLAAVGVECRLLKGAAHAHLDYPDPSWRGFGDVDLLVRSGDYDHAVATLVAVGARRRSDEVRPGFDRRFGKGVCMIRPDGVQVDLHRTLATGPFGMTVDPDDLFAAAGTVMLGDEPVPTLDVDLRFVHACFHAVLGDFPPRITALRDVAQMLSGGAVDLDHVRSIVRGWRAGIVVATAIAAAWTTLRLSRPPSLDWAFAYVPSRFERSALAAYVGPHRSYARQMVTAVPAVRGWGARAAYVSSLLFTDGAYLARRDRGYARRMGRAARTVVRARVAP